jgi:glycosyltransferase involved in cell wall biosynthesis
MPTQEAAREALGVAPGDPLLLFFGTIRPYKGLHTLLAALATVRGAHPEVRLIVAGQPWEPWEQYAAQIASLGLTDNVLPRLGFVPEAEVPSLFAAADLVVLPYTHFDAQSAVGAQALGFGRPLLVTRTGGLPDLVDDDPAWCVAPDDAPALAMALLRFLEDPEENQAAFQRIRARCVARMSWPESAQHHVAQYARLLADR